MSIMVAMMLPFLVGLIVLYPQIGPKESAPESESEEKKNPFSKQQMRKVLLN